MARMVRALIILVVTLTTTNAFANSARIKEIKQLFKEVRAKIKSKAIKSSTVTAKTSWPGIGDQDRTVTFYHRADGALAKVSTLFNVGSTSFPADYLFDGKGKLAFYFTKTSVRDPCSGGNLPVDSQVRFYFSATGRLVRYLRKRADPEVDPDEFSPEFRKTKCWKEVFARRRADRGFTKKELATAKRTRSKAAFLTKLFATFKRGKTRAVHKVLEGEGVDQRL